MQFLLCTNGLCSSFPMISASAGPGGQLDSPKRHWENRGVCPAGCPLPNCSHHLLDQTGEKRQWKLMVWATERRSLTNFMGKTDLAWGKLIYWLPVKRGLDSENQRHQSLFPAWASLIQSCPVLWLGKARALENLLRQAAEGAEFGGWVSCVGRILLNLWRCFCV